MSKTKASLLAVTFILVAIPLLNSCGREDIASCQTSARTGQTSSGYYFDFTMCPYVVEDGGSISLSVRAWDAGGNIAVGVVVDFSGSPDPVSVTTNAQGYAKVSVPITGTAGAVGSVTAMVEGLGITLQYQILPTTEI